MGGLIGDTPAVTTERAVGVSTCGRRPFGHRVLLDAQNPMEPFCGRIVNQGLVIVCQPLGGDRYSR